MRKRAAPDGLADAGMMPAGLRPGPSLFAALPEAAPPPGHLGHRERMRQKLLAAGPDALLDHEMLEMVLFLALPRRDTKPIARDLLARFGSFANAIAAPFHEIRASARPAPRR